MNTGWLVATLTLTALAVCGLHPAGTGRVPRVLRHRPVRPEWARPAWLVAVPGCLSPGHRAALAVASGIAVGLTGSTLGLGWPSAGLAVAVAALAGCVSGRIETTVTRRHREGIVRDLPEVCGLLAAALRAGLPLRGAVEQVVAVIDGPLCDELAQVLDNVRAGQPESEAWRALTGHEPLRRLALDLARSTDSGTALAEVLSEHGRMARTAAQADRRTKARAAGVRSVLPLCVCFLPAFFLIGIAPVIAAGISAFLP
ncbi:MAG: type II secretion system F family protein [Propionibacteriaceae bacterium]